MKKYLYLKGGFKMRKGVFKKLNEKKCKTVDGSISRCVGNVWWGI